MRVALVGAAALLVAASSGEHDVADALSLLQTNSVKVLKDDSLDEKACKAATRARRDALKQMKASKKAAKEARAALKAAKKAALKDQTVFDGAAAAMVDACPVPEVDTTTPDVGCSSTLISSTDVSPFLVQHGFMDVLGAFRPGWFGFEKAVPGTGVYLEKGGKDVTNRLGPAIIQPCSVAWTLGVVQTQYGGFDGMTGKRTGTNYYVWKITRNLASPCACLQWAQSTMPFPEGGAVTFAATQRGDKAGSGHESSCKVFRNGGVKDGTGSALEWIRGGFTPVLTPMSGSYSCYLGNPEEWKLRVDTMKAANQVVDKCSKTSAWASGVWAEAFDPTVSTLKQLYPIGVGEFGFPDPAPQTEEGRKLCLRWAKQDERCTNMTGISTLRKGREMCFCHLATVGVKYQLNTERSMESPSTQICYM